MKVNSKVITEQIVYVSQNLSEITKSMFVCTNFKFLASMTLLDLNVKHQENHNYTFFLYEFIQEKIDFSKSILFFDFLAICIAVLVYFISKMM